MTSAGSCKCVHICQCQLPDSAAVIARPAAVIFCIGRTGQPYYWPTLISAHAAFKASSAFLSRKVSALRSRLGIPVFLASHSPLHVAPHGLTCRIIEWQAPGIMKTQPNPSDREVLAGLVERVTYHNVENGFCVLRAKARGHRDIVTLSAMPQPLRPVSGSRHQVNGSTIGHTASSSRRGSCARRPRRPRKASRSTSHPA